MNTSLEDYSTFQFMLARPSTARAITSNCTSFVFYDGPKDEDELEFSRTIICRGDINTFNYFICCLMVLPSHMLGMSKWISAEDVSSKARKPGDELRRFRYSYYGGFLTVDTRHVCVDNRDGNGSGGDGNEQFRLVEYMDCSISVWILSHAMFVFASSLVAYGVQKSGLFFSDGTSLSSASGITFVALHILLACTGVNVLFGAA